MFPVTLCYEVTNIRTTEGTYTATYELSMNMWVLPPLHDEIYIDNRAFGVDYIVHRLDIEHGTHLIEIYVGSVLASDLLDLDENYTPDGTFHDYSRLLLADDELRGWRFANAVRTKLLPPVEAQHHEARWENDGGRVE